MQSEDTVLINDSNNEIAGDEQDVRKVTTSGDLDSLDAVKSFCWDLRRERMNVMLNELIRKVKTLKLQNFRQSAIHMFFKKWSCKLSQLT